MIQSSEPSVAASSAQAAGLLSGLLRAVGTVRRLVLPSAEPWVPLEALSPRRDTGTNMGESRPLSAGSSGVAMAQPAQPRSAIISWAPRGPPASATQRRGPIGRGPL